MATVVKQGKKLLTPTYGAGNNYFHLTVTQRNIDQAVASNSQKCIFANALRDIPGTEGIDVTNNTMKFTLNGHRYVYPIPGPARSIPYGLDKNGDGLKDKALKDYLATLKPLRITMTGPTSAPAPKRAKRPFKERMKRAERDRLIAAGEIIIQEVTREHPSRRRHGLKETQTYQKMVRVGKKKNKRAA